ncbi:hypothetical protein L484_016380 [Morus notabilis]|uniref:Uncharacterized protein n=1 Tax=Morus notabilis TaxID=981085 RepID=W9SCJ4_9ROSA|nr:hypothetical protein L484_016380 [Morus notabilis]
MRCAKTNNTRRIEVERGESKDLRHSSNSGAAIPATVSVAAAVSVTVAVSPLSPPPSPPLRLEFQSDCCWLRVFF